MVKKIKELKEENHKKQHFISHKCSHKWSNIKTFLATSLDDFGDFVYQQCEKCGLIKRI